MSVVWYHLIVNAKGVNHQSMKSKEVVLSFLKELIHKSGLKSLGEPIVKCLPENLHNKKKKIDGCSWVQLVDKSSITLHFIYSQNILFMDFFSCSSFSVDVVERLIMKYFSPQVLSGNYFSRGI